MLFKAPLKRHSRYNDFDAIAGQLNIQLSPLDNSTFLLPSETY